MSKHMMFCRNGVWSGYNVHEAGTGYVVERWSRVRGEITGRKVLVSFSARYPQGLSLEHTGYVSEVPDGDGLYHASLGVGDIYDPTPGKVLRVGHKVS